MRLRWQAVHYCLQHYAAKTTENSHTNKNKDHSHKQDKVKVDCNDLALVLVILRFSADNLSEDERLNVNSSLNEGEVSSDLQLILDRNLADLLYVENTTASTIVDILKQRGCFVF